MTTRREVALVLCWLLSATQSAVAQDTATFTLADVEASVVKHLPAQAEAPDPRQALAQSLGARRWGMSKAELLAVLKDEIQAQFERRIKVERDIMRQDALYEEAQQRYRNIQGNYIQFNGAKTGWDVSPVAAEFAQNNSESMLVVQNAGSRDLYFFMRGKLWKWYRELAADGAAGEQTLRTLGQRLGSGKPQQDRINDSEEPFPGVVWTVADTRVTALRRGAEMCLIFEDKSTVDRIGALRSGARADRSQQQKGQSLDWALLPDADHDARMRR